MVLVWLAPDISIVADTMNKAESFICIITSDTWPDFVIKLPFPMLLWMIQLVSMQEIIQLIHSEAKSVVQNASHLDVYILLSHFSQLLFHL
jgi:hypothetical protein